MGEYVDLTLDRAIASGDSEDMYLQRTLRSRVAGLESEHSLFRTWCDRADALYYATTFTDWGADLWADDSTATTPGRSHVSVNTPAVYVDVPASLQAPPPIENMLASADEDAARHAAASMERVYKAWKIEEKYELKFHKATVIKGLYGRTAGFVYWDADKKRPCVDVIQNPRNLYLGYKSDDYEEIEWAANVTLQDPNALTEKYSIEWGVRMNNDGTQMPWVLGLADVDLPRADMNFGPARVQVWDYWFRKPMRLGKAGRRTKMETWNVVVVGNRVVSEYRYPEYDGAIPYVPLYNTFIPGAPTGRGELHDMEQLIREKMARITAGAQMIRKATEGDYWQLVGPDAPLRVPPGAKPRLNEVSTPGAGNRIEAIQPFIVQFQLEQFLGRLDREQAVVSGLNDLLLGLAPAQVLSSSKAINALISNYESRLSMRRLLLYSWRKDCWDLAVKVWTRKDDKVKSIVDGGGGVLEITAPSLNPRDELETATKALNLLNGKVWSLERAMDATGVDDPEQEQNLIRANRTDATLFPADVQVMAQLLATLQQLQLAAPPAVQGQAQEQMARGQNDLRTALGAATPTNSEGAPSGGDTGVLPPAALVEGGTAPAAGAFAAPQAGQGDASTVLQGMIQGGQAKGRIMTQRRL